MPRARLRLVLAALLATGCRAPAPPAALSGDEAARVDAVIDAARARRGFPGLAVGVVRGDRLVWLRGDGARDDAGEPLARIAHTAVFRIGSLTKLVTGLAVRQLDAAGALRLDDAAASYLPELGPLLAPAGAPPVTIRHLISHGSGLPSLGNGRLDWTTGDHELTLAELFGALDGVHLEFAPGTRTRYSNLGAALAGVVIARATGQPYRRYVDDHVLAPLGMTSSWWDRAAVPAGRLVEGHARRGAGYAPGGPHWRLGALEALGGLYSTVDDLARFAVFAAHDPSPEPRLGWMVQAVPGVGAVAWHSGSTLDYGAWLGLAPDADAAVLALASTGDLDDVAALGQLGAGVLAALAPR